MGYISKVNIDNTQHSVGSSLYGTCESLASAGTKVVVMPDFDQLITGVTIHVKFSYSNTANFPTLQVNNTDALTIMKDNDPVGTTVGTSWPSGAVVSFTYDGNYWMMNNYNIGVLSSAVTNINSTSPGMLDVYKQSGGAAVAELIPINGWAGLTSDVSDIQDQIGSNTLGTSVPKYDALFTDHRYSFAEGDENGTINVTSVVNTPNDLMPIDEQPMVSVIPVHGLQALAYKASLTAAEVGAIPTSAKGVANGVATLDSTGKVPASELPSYVDDVIEYTNYAAFPSTGEAGKIYVAKDTNKTYRWSGSAYVELKGDLALGETSSTAYRGDRGKVAYDHATDANRLTTAKTTGFYKVAVTAEGHVGAATAVTKNDIVNLGIPSSDTQFTGDTTTIDSVKSFKAGTAPTLGTAIPADDITGWNAGTKPSLTISTVACDDITAWNAGAATSLSVSNGVLTVSNGTSPSLSYTARSVGSASGWSDGTLPSLSYTAKTIPNVTSVGTAAELTTEPVTVVTNVHPVVNGDAPLPS